MRISIDIDVRVVVNVGSWVWGEFDRVVLSLVSEMMDVFYVGLWRVVKYDIFEEVVGWSDFGNV